MADKLKSELISRSSIDEALALAALCFPKISDQKLIGLDFWAFLRNKPRGTDSLLEKPATAVGYYIFRDSKQLAGMSGLYQYEDDPKTLWFCWVGVHPTVQRHGYGKQIIEHACNEATELKLNTIACVTNNDSSNSGVHQFYERLGFKNEKIINFRDEVLREYRLILCDPLTLPALSLPKGC